MKRAWSWSKNAVGLLRDAAHASATVVFPAADAPVKSTTRPPSPPRDTASV